MIDEIKELEPIPSEQTITVNTEADLSNSVPRCTLTLQVITLESGIKYVKSGYIELLDRICLENGTKKQLREYPMPDIEAYFYYTPEGKMAAMLLNAYDDGDNVASLDEIEKTISLAKDKELFQAFRFLSYYWVAMQAGLSFAQQTIEIARNAMESQDDA